MVEEIDPFADAVVIDETDDPFADAEIYGSSTEALEGNSNDTLNPTFPTNMWDGWKLEDAEATYQTIITGKNVVKDPYAEQMGEAVYFYVSPDTGKRTVIPKPTPAWFGMPGLLGYKQEATVSPSKVIAAGFGESVGDAAVLGTAIYDKVAGTNYTPEAEKRVPNIDTSMSTVDGLMADGIPAMVMGGGVGSAVFKGFNWTPKLIQVLSKVWGLAPAVRGTSSVVAGELAATSTVGTDEGNLLFGKDAVIPAFPDIAELGDDEASQVIEQRLNTFADAILITPLATTVGFGAVKVLGVAADFLIGGYKTIFGGEDAIEKAVYLQLSKELANVKPNATAEELAVARQNLAKIIEENKDVLIRSMDGISSDPVLRDTVSAIMRGTDDTADRANAAGIRAGAMNTEAGSPISVAMDRPAVAIQEDLATQRAVLGGETPEEQTDKLLQGADTFVEQERRAIDTAQGGLEGAEQDFAVKSASVLDGFETDLEFGSDLKRLEDVTGTKIGETRIAKLDTVNAGLRDGYEQMSLLKDELYAEIMGGAVDTDGIVSLLAQLKPLQLDAAYNAIAGGDTQMTKILGTMQRVSRMVNEKISGDEALSEADFDAMYSDAMRGWFAKQQLDFGKLYTEIRPVVSSTASNLFNSTSAADKAAGRVLRDFVRYIDQDAVDFVRNSNPDLATAAVAAKKFYVDDFAPIWRSQGKMQEFAELYDRTIGRTAGDNLTARITGNEFARSGFDEGVDAITTGIMAPGGNRMAVTNMATAVQYSGDPSAIADYMILDVINSFATDVRTAGMQGANFKDFSTRLQSYATQLREAFPEKADSIDRFILRLEDAGTSQAELQKVLDGATERAGQAMEQVRRGVIARFFINNDITPKAITRGDDLATTSNPYAAFERLYKGAEAVQNTQDLMARIAIAPEAERKALIDSAQLAYNKYLDDFMFGRSTNTNGTRVTNSAKFDRSNEELTSVLRVGRELYADRPEVMDALEATLEAASDMARSANSTPIRSQSATGYNRQATTATNRLIYATVGPLTRAGTRIRSLSQALINSSDPDSVAKKVTQNLLKDPEYFLLLARKYNTNPGDPLLADSIVRYALSGVLKTEYEDSSQAEDDEGFLSGTFNSLGESAQELGRAVGSLTGTR